MDKYTAKGFSYERALADTEKLVPKVNTLLVEFEELLRSDKALNAFGHSWDDLYVLPSLRVLTCVKALVWPTKVRALCGEEPRRRRRGMLLRACVLKTLCKTPTLHLDLLALPANQSMLHSSPLHVCYAQSITYGQGGQTARLVNSQSVPARVWRLQNRHVFQFHPAPSSPAFLQALAESLLETAPRTPRTGRSCGISVTCTVWDAHYLAVLRLKHLHLSLVMQTA